MNRRLLRRRKDRMLGGVCGGLADLLEIDPTIVRVIFVLLGMLGGHGVLLYLILWLIVPSEEQINQPI